MSRTVLEGMRVLVMEDEFLIAMDVEQICRDHGALEVVIARTLDAFDPQAEYHAAVLDVMLAGRSTFDAAAVLARRGIPFVFATGYAESDDRFAEFPGVHVIGKPYGGRELVTALTSAMTRPRAVSGGV